MTGRQKKTSYSKPKKKKSSGPKLVAKPVKSTSAYTSEERMRANKKGMTVRKYRKSQHKAAKKQYKKDIVAQTRKANKVSGKRSSSARSSSSSRSTTTSSSSSGLNRWYSRYKK